MRQAPQYAIIGSGRMAKHFSHYLDQLKISYLSWNRNNFSLQDLNFVLSRSDHILILIKDSAIEDFILQNISKLQNKKLIHFSGALSTSLAVGMHPLMTFSEKLYSFDIYKETPFIIDDLNISFADIFPSLPNKSYKISKEDKAFYHSLCVLSGNFSCMLWNKLFNDLESKLGIEKQAAFPYLKKITENILHNSEKSLTGPIVRNDLKTINSNLKALNDDSFQQVYEAFVNSYNSNKR